MSTEHPDWGRRLSDALRAAIGRNDLAAALALAREGDGQARSLASEFLLMSRGLGITVRVLLGQLGGLTEGLTPSSGTVPDSQALERDLRRLLADFRGSLEGPQEGRDSVLGDGLAGGQAGDRGGESLPEVAQFTLRVLQARQQRFESDQALAAQQVIDALLAHDAARASQWLERKEIHDYLPYHDRLVRFMAATATTRRRRNASCVSVEAAATVTAPVA